MITRWLINVLLSASLLLLSSDAISSPRPKIELNDTVKRALALLYEDSVIPKAYTESQARTNAYLALASAGFMAVLFYRHLDRFCSTFFILGILYINIQQIVNYLSYAGNIREKADVRDRRIFDLLKLPQREHREQTEK